MSTNDTSWDDTGFDADDDAFFGGTAKPQPPTPEPMPSEAPAPTEPVPEPAAEPAEPAVRRIEFPASVPPSLPPQPTSKRGPIVWMAMAAGIILIVAIGGALFWYMSKPTAEEELLLAQTDEPAAAAPTSQPVAADTTPQRIDTPLVVKQEEAPPQAQAEVHTEPQNTERPQRERPKRQEPVTPPPAPPVTKKEAPMPKAPQIATSPAPPTKAKPLFVVQVFSSPSRDDAEEWLQSLREKNVNDGYITEQQIKGQPWYRVRFGQFERREDAEAAAMNIGLTQPWVARIR